MRVLVVTNMFPTDDRPNYGTFVKSQIDSLREGGVDFDILYVRGYRGKWRYLTAMPKVFWRSFTGRYDLIHAHYGLCGLVARMQWRLPVVVSFCGDDLYGHSDERGRPTRSSLIWVWLHKRLATRVRHVIVKSEAMKRLLPDCGAAVVPNGVDFSVFAPADREGARAEIGRSGDAPIVLFPYDPGRIRKNFALARAAVDAANARRGERAPPIELLVVKDQPNERLPAYMNAADALLVTSYWEGSPNAVKEALACNLPVVSVDVGDARELIGGVRGCQIVEPDPASIAAAIEIALESGRSDGRERSDRLRIENVAEQVHAIYQKALRRGEAASTCPEH